MTNEQEKAKELAKLLNAFADGKQLQAGGCEFDDYQVASILKLTKDFLHPYHFRIKPKTKWIALNQQDLIDRELSGKTMRMKIGNEIRLITKWDEHYLWIDGYQYYYDSIVMEYPFLDNSPCYKEVECE